MEVKNVFPPYLLLLRFQRTPHIFLPKWLQASPDLMTKKSTKSLHFAS